MYRPEPTGGKGKGSWNTYVKDTGRDGVTLNGDTGTLSVDDKTFLPLSQSL